MTKVLVTMGRRYGFKWIDDSYNTGYWVIDEEVVDTFKTALWIRFGHKFPMIIHGCAPGEDMLVAKYLRIDPTANEERYPADWEVFGKSAGPKRNLQMLEKGKPDICLAFPGGKGTEHMKKLCRKAGIEVVEIV